MTLFTEYLALIEWDSRPTPLRQAIIINLHMVLYNPRVPSSGGGGGGVGIKTSGFQRFRKGMRGNGNNLEEVEGNFL